MPTTAIAERELRHAIVTGRADHPRSRTLLTNVLDTLAPVARRVNADPADALSHAFELWCDVDDALLVADTFDLLAYTRTAVSPRAGPRGRGNAQEHPGRCPQPGAGERAF